MSKRRRTSLRAHGDPTVSAHVASGSGLRSDSEPAAASNARAYRGDSDAGLDKISDDERSDDEGSIYRPSDNEGLDDEGSIYRASDDEGLDDEGLIYRASDDEGLDDEGSNDEGTDDEGTADEEPTFAELWRETDASPPVVAVDAAAPIDEVAQLAAEAEELDRVASELDKTGEGVEGIEGVDESDEPGGAQHGSAPPPVAGAQWTLAGLVAASVLLLIELVVRLVGSDLSAWLERNEADHYLAPRDGHGFLMRPADAGAVQPDSSLERRWLRLGRLEKLAPATAARSRLQDAINNSHSLDGARLAAHVDQERLGASGRLDETSWAGFYATQQARCAAPKMAHADDRAAEAIARAADEEDLRVYNLTAEEPIGPLPYYQPHGSTDAPFFRLMHFGGDQETTPLLKHLERIEPGSAGSGDGAGPRGSFSINNSFRARGLDASTSGADNIGVFDIFTIALGNKASSLPRLGLLPSIYDRHVDLAEKRIAACVHSAGTVITSTGTVANALHRRVLQAETLSDLNQTTITSRRSDGETHKFIIKTEYRFDVPAAPEHGILCDTEEYLPVWLVVERRPGGGFNVVSEHRFCVHPTINQRICKRLAEHYTLTFLLDADENETMHRVGHLVYADARAQWCYRSAPPYGSRTPSSSLRLTVAWVKAAVAGSEGQLTADELAKAEPFKVKRLIDQGWWSPEDARAKGRTILEHALVFIDGVESQRREKRAADGRASWNADTALLKELRRGELDATPVKLKLAREVEAKRQQKASGEKARWEARKDLHKQIVNGELDKDPIKLKLALSDRRLAGPPAVHTRQQREFEADIAASAQETVEEAYEARMQAHDAELAGFANRFSALQL